MSLFDSYMDERMIEMRAESSGRRFEVPPLPTALQVGLHIFLSFSFE